MTIPDLSLVKSGFGVCCSSLRDSLST